MGAVPPVGHISSGGTAPAASLSVRPVVRPPPVASVPDELIAPTAVQYTAGSTGNAEASAAAPQRRAREEAPTGVTPPRKRGSRKAVEIFREALSRYPDSLKFRWLLITSSAT